MIARKASEIPVDLICTNPHQPRRTFAEEELMELSDSIREYGVLQPVILKKAKTNRYVLIAGERRYRAAQIAGLSKIPAVIRESGEEESAVIALVENVQRENLDYLEEARAYKKLIDDYGLSQTEISKKIGKKQSTISNKIRLLALPEDMHKALAENRLTERHARALLKIPEDETRRMALNRIAAHGLNVKQSEKLIEDILFKREEERRKSRRISHISYKIYLNSLRKTFGEIFQVENKAKYYQEDKGEYVEVKVLIPKNERECFT